MQIAPSYEMLFVHTQIHGGKNVVENNPFFNFIRTNMVHA